MMKRKEASRENGGGSLAGVMLAGVMVLLPPAVSFADGTTGWRHSFREPLPATDVGSSNMHWAVTADGNTLFELAAGTDACVTFTNVSVDVDAHPVLSLDVPRAAGSWKLEVGLHGGGLSEVFESASAGHVAVNLADALGWSGQQAMDIRLGLVEDLSGAVAAAIPFDLGSCADKDVIFEAGGAGAADVFGEGAGATACFVEDGHDDGTTVANGLPANRLLASGDADLGNYVLLPYDRNNIIELSSHYPTAETNVPVKSYLIDVPDQRYSKIGMLVSSAEGDTSFTITFNYLDGTAVTNWYESDDWYQSSRPSNIDVITGMDRATAADGTVEDSNHFNLYEYILTNVDTNKVLDSITVGNRPNHWPGGEWRYGGVFAVNGAASVVATRSVLEARELALSASPGWRTFDRFDTHHWVSRFPTKSYGKFEPFDPYYDGWKHPHEAEFSTAHPVEGEMGLKVKVPIEPGPDFNWMHFEVDLPEPEDWSSHKILTFDPYMEGSPLSLPLMGLIVESAGGGIHRVPMILGWQLFQWENRQMTWPLQGNVEAGEDQYGNMQYQIPPIPMDILSNVVKVSCGFEYYYDPEETETCVHMDNMRLGAVSMWDSFEGPEYGWYNEDEAMRVGVTHNQRFKDSAGSLCIAWPCATNYAYARTEAGAWQDNWQAYSRIRARVYATAADTVLRVSVNGIPTAPATNSVTDAWEPIVWEMPAGITTVTNIEIGVADTPGAGRVYVDQLEVGTEAGRVESVKGWALRGRNRLAWSLSSVAGVDKVMVRYDTDRVPTNAADGTLLVEISSPSQESFVEEHTGVGDDTTYYYAVFLEYAGGGTSPLTADAALELSRYILVVGGSGSYEAGFSKDNGSLLYVHNVAGNETVCYGSEDLNLWRIIFTGEESPDLMAAWFSPDNPNLRFSYTESPLVLNYDYVNGDESLSLCVAVDSSATNRFRLNLGLTNNTAHAIRTVECPRRIGFAIAHVNRVAFPIQEGMAFTRGFFEEGRYTIQPRPWLFADYIGLDSEDGLFSLFAIQDSFYGSDILRRHDAGKPVFQPANIGVGASMNDPSLGFMDYEMVTYIPAGGSWNSPTVVLETGGDDLRSPLAHYKDLNSFNDTDKYPALKQKLDAFGLFDKIAGSPVMAIECEKVVSWQKAPYGDLWSTIRRNWLDVLPRDNILHFTHWQEGILEDEHPDCQPIFWERYGAYDAFTNMLAAAHGEGWMVMPFCNWTVWNKHDVVQRDEVTGDLLPIPEACLKERGTPFYEYLGYMIKPWHDSVYEVHSNMMEFYRTGQPMDAMFVDMTCERTWRYTRIDTDDDGQDETIFTGYTQATIDHNNFLKQFLPLYTEGVLDQMMGEVSGYCQTHRQKMMMDILRHVGDEFDDWVIFPLAAEVAHDHVGFYQHDLNLQVFPRTKPLLTHYTVMGYSYIVDVATWYGEADANGWNWMYICDDFQKAIVSKCFGEPLASYDGAVEGDIHLIRTSYGTGTNAVAVLGNFRSDASLTTNGCTIAPQGFMATMTNGMLIAGIFTHMFNGAPLSGGEHCLAVERTDDATILVRHPAGADTRLAVNKPATWSDNVRTIYVLRDGTELAAPGRAEVIGDRIVLDCTARTDDGSIVSAYKLADAGADVPPVFLSIPIYETVNATQVWVLVQADKPVKAVVTFGVDAPGGCAVTNEALSLSHAVLVTLPVAGQDYWFKVSITDADGRSTESGRMFYPAGGFSAADDMDTIFMGEPGVVRLDISEVAEKDIIVDTGDTANDVFGEHAGDLHCFVQEGYDDGTTVADGLPANRLVPSSDSDLGTYVLQPYSEPNVLELDSSGCDEQHYMPVPPGHYQKVGILAASCQGDVSFGVYLHYEDGGTSENWWETADWFGPLYPERDRVIKVITNMDRAVAASGVVDDQDQVHLYEYILDDESGVWPDRTLVGISIGDMDGRHWPVDPAAYAAVFAVNAYGPGVTYDLEGWRDSNVSPVFGCYVESHDGKAVVSIEGASGGTNVGRVLSPVMTIDLDRFPILEMQISEVEGPGVTYTIALQEEVGPYSCPALFEGSRAGTLVIDIPMLSGWRGQKTFSLSIGLGNTNADERSVHVERYTFRSDRNVAWEEDFAPPRDTWQDESDNSGLNAELEAWAGGLARLQSTGDDDWGQAQSESIALDLAHYPWLTAVIDSVDASAVFKAGVQFLETPPCVLTTVVSAAAGPATVSGPLELPGPGPMEVLSAAIVIECDPGETRSAYIDRLQIAKRPTGGSQLTWDTTDTSFSVGEENLLWVPVTATDHDGGPVRYGSLDLPAGATYNGILEWVPSPGDAGTYDAYVIASNDLTAITNAITIVVTDNPYHLPAPEWTLHSVTTATEEVALDGSYWGVSPSVLVEVSVDGQPYTAVGVAQDLATFTWTGAIARTPMTVDARTRDTSSGKISAPDRCEVRWPLLEPAFLGVPTFEARDATSVWVTVRATEPVAVTVGYGLDDVDENETSSAGLTISHALSAAPLEAGRDYWFQVEITDADGNRARSDAFWYAADGIAWDGGFDTDGGDPGAVRFDLSGHVDKDLVHSIGDEENDTLGTGAGFTACFAEDSWKASGLPSSRLLFSPDAHLGVYALLPYDGLNAIELATMDAVENHTIAAPVAGRYDKIGILAAAAGGDVSFTIKCHYDDDTVATLWWETDDWYDLGPRGNVAEVIGGMNRVNATTGDPDGDAHFHLYEFVLDAGRGLDTSKNLEAISIGVDPNRWPTDQERYAAVLAVNGYGAALGASGLTDWRDARVDSGFVCEMRAIDGVGVVTVPGAAPGSTSAGKVLSPVMTVDVDRYPILEVALRHADYPNVGYQVRLQQETSPYANHLLFGDTRSGTMILDIPQLTGWTGEQIFSVEFAMSSDDTNDRSIVIDHLELRADRNVAWLEDFEPPRSTWQDERSDAAFDALLVYTGGTTAAVTRNNEGTWGKVQTEMIIMDLSRYPWVTAEIESIDPVSNLKVWQQSQVSYKQANIITPAAAPCTSSVEVAKLDDDVLDLTRFLMTLEGPDNAVVLERMQISRRVTDGLVWDPGVTSLKVPQGERIVLPVTATDYEGGPVGYGAETLPDGAAYNGIFEWTAAAPAIGTYRFTAIASNADEAIRREVAITVTNETIQFVAPRWETAWTNIATNVIALSGTFPAEGDDVIVEVSTNGGASYTTDGVAQGEGTFTWSAVFAVEGTNYVDARVRDTVTGKRSGNARCTVAYVIPELRFLIEPVLETENATQVWAIVRTSKPAAVEVRHGTSEATVGEFVESDPNYWLTHAVLVTLDAGQDYWFRMVATDDEGVAITNRLMFYPAGGEAWCEAFDGDVGSWVPHPLNPVELAINGLGQGVFTIEAPRTYGCIETACMTVDLNSFPIFDMYVVGTDTSGGQAYYQVVLKNLDPPYDQPTLIHDFQVGSAVLNIRDITGWSGTKRFAVVVWIQSLGTEDRHITMEHMMIRADRNVAWIESAEPLLKSTWIDEVTDPTLNAYVEDNGDGSATLRESGDDVWGKVLSEMVFLNMADYPWLGMTGPGVDSNASMKVTVRSQRGGEMNEATLITYDSTDSGQAYTFNALMDKLTTNMVDFFQHELVIEGHEKAARIDRLQIAKRPVERPHMLFWDFPPVNVCVGAGTEIEIPFTATAYDGEEILYTSASMPGGATYDGFFRWTPTQDDVGTYSPFVIAQNAHEIIAAAISITVTGVYTVHLAYDDQTGMDTMPQALAEEDYYTGAASMWMFLKNLLGAGFSETQSQIYDATLHDPTHHDEITPPSCVDYLGVRVPAPYHFVYRGRSDLQSALREVVYWIDYQPDGGVQNPAMILCGTNWKYKVVRGFQTDIKPYAGGYAPATNITIFGLWLNDPLEGGIGFNMYVPAVNMDEVYAPSLTNGKYLLVADPPAGEAFDEAVERMERMAVQAALPKTSVAMARYVGALIRIENGGPMPRNSRSLLMPDLAEVIPAALLEDGSFMRLAGTVQEQQSYVVNAEDPETAYVLLAGGVYGPASTVYVLKLSTEGAMDQVTWSYVPERYLPVNRDAAVWIARQRCGVSDVELVDARLVYSPERCRSVYFPEWEVELRVDGQVVVTRVGQETSLAGDADGDGMLDGDELYAGSDPGDGDSVFALGEPSAVAESSGDANVVIRWPSHANRRYGVFRSPSLMEGFSRIADGIEATPPENTFTDSVRGAVMFYRIDVE
ncbi:MAG: hypothetical protein JXB04_02865 [Kiritimatiellae bacterium]|nr:hypothetical protein [Kiritimatiellia bacterium]